MERDIAGFTVRSFLETPGVLLGGLPPSFCSELRVTARARDVDLLELQGARSGRFGRR